MPLVVSSIPKKTQEDIHGIRTALERIAAALEAAVHAGSDADPNTLRGYGDPAAAEVEPDFTDTGLYETEDEELALVEDAEARGVTPEELYRILALEEAEPRQFAGRQRQRGYDEETDEQLAEGEI